MQNEVNSIKFSISLSFCAGPSLPGLATVSVLLFEKEEYFHSTSHYSPLGIILLYELLLPGHLLWRVEFVEVRRVTRRAGVSPMESNDS